jgi:hypothetical protein
MKIFDLVTSKDGSLSLTKLAASTFHFALAVWVSVTTYKVGFDLAIWAMYGGFAVGHAGYDKTMAVVANFQNKKLDKNDSVIS